MPYKRPWFNKLGDEYKTTVAEYQRVIDDLTMQLELANLENERLSKECLSLEQGRNDQDVNHEGILVEYLEKIQSLIEENKELIDIVEAHDKHCLPSL